MKICDKLVPFVDGELPTWEAADFRDHLPGCQSCRDGALRELQISSQLSTMQRSRLRSQVTQAQELTDLFQRRYFRRRVGLHDHALGFLKFLWICTWPIRALVRGLLRGQRGGV